ncbi:MAG: DUF1189 family protein [Alphaproteobacteria bacterium]|nr:DUF1189 family protein [Alphaproteobacteria bacterium]
MFSFLYRVFYDRTLFSLYIEKGKGYGIKLLFILTLFTAFCFALRLFWLFSLVPSRLIDEFAAQIPEIKMEKGEITAPENHHYTYISENGRVFFVFDTSGEPINLKDLPSAGIYITADAIVTARYGELRRVPFVKVLSKPDFYLSQNNIRSVIKEALSLSKIFVPPVMFVFCIPGIFSAYFFMAIFGLAVSFIMVRFVKIDLTWEQRARLAVLSIMPASVLNALSITFNIGAPLELFSIAIILIYMFCFLTDGQKAIHKATVIER